MPPNQHSIKSSLNDDVTPRQQLLSNKVFIPWYKRYMHTLPEHEQIEFQPYEEIDKREEDIAMQFVYGEEVNIDEPDEQRMRQIRRQAVVQHLHYRERVEKRKIMDQGAYGFKAKTSIVESNAAPSVTSIIANRKAGNKLPDDFEGGRMLESERKMCEKITSFLNKKRTLTRRKRLMGEMKERGFSIRNSKWSILHRLDIRKELVTTYKIEYRARVRLRFRKGINLVFACNRFIFILAELSGDTGNIVKDIREFQQKQLTRLDQNGQANAEAKFIFEPKKYMLSSETPLSKSVLFILTKPWHDRTKQEVDIAVKSLQILRCFAELPINTQRYLATVAWSISIPEDKVMIRQGHEAQDYYILLSGRVSKTVFVGDPCGQTGHEGNGRFKFVRTYSKDSIFGEEALTRPGSERDYSMTSCIKCDILSINVHDYFKCSMTPSDIRSSAPDHIKFISHCAFLNNFPKAKLIEDAEDNIYIAYFRPDSVIEKKMSESKWLYVVKWGSCKALIELPPSRKIRELHHDNIVLMENEKADEILMEDRMTEPSKKRVDVEDKEANRRNLIGDIVKQEMSRAKKATSDNESTRKESSLDEIGLIRAKGKAISGLLQAKRNNEQKERNDFYKVRISLSEQKPDPESIRKSTNVPTILKEDGDSGPSLSNIPKLPPIFRTSIMSNESRQNSRKVSFQYEDDEPKTEEEEKQEEVEEEEEVVVEEEEEEEEEGGFESLFDPVNDNLCEYESTSCIESTNNRRPTSTVVGTQYKVEELAGKMFLPSTKTSTNNYERKQSVSFKSTASDDSTTSSEKKRKSCNKKSRISVDEKLAAIQIEKKRQKSIRKDPRAVMIPTATHSIWKLKKNLVKGDQAGFETINLDDGMFRPPNEDPALVSDGCELVMIRKAFIEKYLGADARQEQFRMK